MKRKMARDNQESIHKMDKSTKRFSFITCWEANTSNEKGNLFKPQNSLHNGKTWTWPKGKNCSCPQLLNRMRKHELPHCLRTFPCDSLGVQLAWFLHSIWSQGHREVGELKVLPKSLRALTYFPASQSPAASSSQICLQAMQHLPADFCLQTNPKHTEVQCGKKSGFQS